MERALETLTWYCLNSGGPPFLCHVYERVSVDKFVTNPCKVTLAGPSLTLDVQLVYICLWEGHQSCFGLAQPE